MARAYLESDDYTDEPAAPRPPMSEFSPVLEALQDIGNQIRAMRMEQIGVAGGKPPKIDMLRGPKTALEGMTRRAELKAHYDLTARLLPHKAEEMRKRAAELG